MNHVIFSVASGIYSTGFLLAGSFWAERQLGKVFHDLSRYTFLVLHSFFSLTIVDVHVRIKGCSLLFFLFL